MATTSLWRVKGDLGKVVRYADDPTKNTNPEYTEKNGPVSGQETWLSDVIDYAMQSSKTEFFNERAEIKERFVTGIHCMPETAREEMMATKMKYTKPGGVVAYHGYQSFAPGEGTPELAHKIGIKLAKQLWGDRFEIVVATHLDKADRLHTHFVINTVSFVDGRKFYRSERDYFDMQHASDSLCREYGLSVVERPGQSKTKHYSEWQAERNGHPTWRSLVKSDVDTAIRRSMTERQFFENLRSMGYEIKGGKDISVRPPGKERFVRLLRNFGDDYSIEGIRRRILAQTRPERISIPASPEPKKAQFVGVFHRAYRQTGLRALYLYYLYRMGGLPKSREPSPKRVYFLLREDIRFIQRISQETRLLVKHRIDTREQLTVHKEALTARITALSLQRQRFRNQLKGIREDDKLAAVKSEIANISKSIVGLRREVKLCDEIDRRSTEMEYKLRRVREDEKQKGKERIKHELYR